jgi:serine/threonine protein kinase
LEVTTWEISFAQSKDAEQSSLASEGKSRNLHHESCRFRLAEVFADHSGQGEVYVCNDKFLDRKVAIKVMTNVSETEEIRKELASIQAIRSRHVAQIYDIVQSKKSGAIGLVEEFVPGADVGTHASTNDMADKYLRILYQIACGLADIHASGKIHRDIKPRNIKFDGEQIIKILDFGLTADGGPGAETIDARGTPCYIAPELYGDPPIKYTVAVDTFAFGVTARVIIQGGALLPGFRQTPPYGAPLPTFESCPISLPQDITKILNGTLEVNPRKRPDMSAVRDILATRLLFGRHRAIITYGSNHELSTPGKSVNLKIGNDGIAISYDGLSFLIATISGDVYVNNMAANAGDLLPHSCVITLGSPQIGFGRTYVPFNVSHPGVVL